jgi:hypothetical protein
MSAFPFLGKRQLSSRVESARVTLKFLSPRSGKSKRRSPRRPLSTSSSHAFRLLLYPVAIGWLTIELVSDFLKGWVVNGRRPSSVASQSKQRRADPAVFAELVTNLHPTIAAVTIWRVDESEGLADGFMPSGA